MCHRQIMKCFLLSIIPSEDIVIKIMQLRTLVFKKYGLVSARTLPVMIPVTYVPKAINKDLFESVTLPEALCTTDYSNNKGGDIYLQIKNTNFINEIRNRIDSFETPGIIDLQTGFYLATANTDSVLKDVLNFVHLEIQEIFTWRKSNLELIRIETINDIWWENIRWETIWEQKLRRQEKGNRKFFPSYGL